MGYLSLMRSSALEVAMLTLILAAVALAGLYLWTLAEENDDQSRSSYSRGSEVQDHHFNSIL